MRPYLHDLARATSIWFLKIGSKRQRFESVRTMKYRHGVFARLKEGCISNRTEKRVRHTESDVFLKSNFEKKFFWLNVEVDFSHFSLYLKRINGS